VTSLEESIRAWPERLKDLSNGKDVVTWAQMAMKEYGPALFGQQASGITIEPVLRPDEQVRGSFPCFFDDDPSEQPASATKVKAHGKWVPGMMVVTDRRIAVSMDLKGQLYMVYSLGREQVTAVNKLQFAFSKLSMTAASDGYEILYDDAHGTQDRILFRVAFEIVSLPVQSLLEP
jgi:hypothetical protein